MKVSSLSFLVSSLVLLSSHFNFAEGGKKEANEKGKRKRSINNRFLFGNGGLNDISDCDDAEHNYIVVFKKNTSIKDVKAEAKLLTKKANGKLMKIYFDSVKGFSATLTCKAMNELQNNPDVAYIEEDAVQNMVNDCTTATQSSVPSWGLDRIDFAATQPTSKLDDNYSYVEDGPAQEVHVYVIDSGIKSSHDEFDDRLGDGFGAVNNVPGTSGSWEDCGSGHGTHVAGTIGGRQYGVTKNANIVLHAVRVFNCEGRSVLSDILEAYDWVIAQCTNTQRICVANGSFNGIFSQSANDGAASLVEAGIVYVVAAGNKSEDACETSPASTEGVIAVGSTTIDDHRSDFSNFGECVEIFAPGSDITSAGIDGDSNNAAIEWSGTSMASPHVAGVAALIRQLDPTLTPAEVTLMIRRHALENAITDVGPESPNLLLQVPPLTCELPSLLPASVPTFAPSITSAPTFTPTSCIHTFRLALFFDFAASETSWDLKDPSDRIVASGSEYSHPTSDETICIDDGEYTFTIYDSHGDGMCCNFGDGYYSIFLDEILVKHGGSFGSSETTYVGEQEASISAPTPAPTFTPTSCIHTFRLELFFDSAASETSWDLKDPSDKIFASGSEYFYYAKSHATYNETICIDDGEYTFTIYDSYGDGICCTFGDGYYSIFLDGVLVNHGGSFDFTETTNVGEEASKSPTSSPSETASSVSVCENFAVHAGAAITFAASNEVIGGDVGISPGTSITGAYELVDGAELANAHDSALFAASVLDAWVAAMEIRDHAMAFAIEMGGKTFTPGTWHSRTITIAAGATVYLDAQGDPNSEFLFQADLTLVAGAGVTIVPINGAKAENVLWAFGTAAVFGADANFEGSMLAGTAITFGADNKVHGCVVALTAITFGAGNTVAP